MMVLIDLSLLHAESTIKKLAKSNRQAQGLTGML